MSKKSYETLEIGFQPSQMLTIKFYAKQNNMSLHAAVRKIVDSYFSDVMKEQDKYGERKS